MEDMRTVRQWSLHTGVPYRAILNAVKDGELPGLRFAERGQIFVKTEDFEAWYEKAKKRAVQDSD
jgi:hypothetical protein